MPTSSEVIRRQAEAAGLADTVVVNTCAVTARGGAAGAPGHPQAQARAPERAHRGHRLRRADRAGDLRRHAGGRAASSATRRSSAPRSGARIATFGARAFGSSAEEKIAVNDIMAVTRDRRAPDRRPRRAARAPSCRCRTAATTAAPSASSRTGAAIRARCRWARWWRRCAASSARGYREVVLTGVDLTSYGVEPAGRAQARHAGEADPRSTCRSSSGCGSPRSIRSKPTATCSMPSPTSARLMPHLHLSLQAGDDLILKRMKRRHLRADAIAFCEQVRRLRPDVVFGGDIIAGFPTETEDDVRPLARSGRRMRAHPPARVSVLAAPRHAGGAHAAGPARDRQGARPPAAREGRGGAAPRISTREIGARRRVLTESRRARPHRAFHAGAARAPVEPGVIVDLTVAGHDGRQLLAA